MSLGIWGVDAFTDQSFAGNPAGVCLLDRPADPAWMQSLAAEINLSETAFLLPQADGFDLRWFTPVTEVDLCGHATLASAHVLWSAGHLDMNQPARFHTRSGLLGVVRLDDGWMEMDFPATPAQEATPPAELLSALGVTARFVGRSCFDYLVEVEDESMVRNLQPDWTRLAGVDTRGVIVTARSNTPGLDFVSRFFAPAVGVNEDPVTGSAHSCLGPYWGRRLGLERLTAFQASARGGLLRLSLAGERVLIGGQAVTVWEGRLSRAAGVK